MKWIDRLKERNKMANNYFKSVPDPDLWEKYKLKFPWEATTTQPEWLLSGNL